MKDVSNIVIEGAQQAERYWMTKMKILDEGAVALRIEIQPEGERLPDTGQVGDTGGENLSRASTEACSPPVAVRINGTYLCEINTRAHRESPGFVQNSKVVWYSAKVREGGIEKLKIELSPIDGAEDLFLPARIESAFEPHLRKTLVEKQNHQYTLPPPPELAERHEPHRVPITLPFKRRGIPLFRKQVKLKGERPIWACQRH